MKTNEKVAKFWGRSVIDSPLDIYSFQPTRDYFSNLVTGKNDHNVEDQWFELWFKTTYLKEKAPVKNCLSLCSGHGDRDRRIAKLGFFKNCLSLDISEDAIKNASQAALKEEVLNIEYKIADLNVDRLEKDAFDLVYVGAGMHHISNLEHLVNEIHECLKPGGLFVCDEYVGPNYSDLSFRHREIINSAVHLIPQRLRFANEDTFVPGDVKRSLWVAWMHFLSKMGRIDFDAYTYSEDWSYFKKIGFNLAKKLNTIFKSFMKPSQSFKYGKVFDIFPENIKQGDPSEGVRAAEIIPILKSKFKHTNVHYYNGSIIVYALDAKFFKNYDASSLVDRKILEQVINLEKAMIEIGEIPPVHATVVCQKL